MMKNIFIIGGLAILLLIGGVWWTNALQDSDPSVISRNGLHWHPTLTIYVKGEKQEIPQGIGLGAVHLPMHTHDDLPIIHLEFSGVVKEEDLMLGHLFTNWGNDMRSFGSNVLPSDERGSTEASRPNVHMTVNGVENIEYERYIMRDKDVIELHYD